MYVEKSLSHDTPVDKRIILATNATSPQATISQLKMFGMHVGAIGIPPSTELMKRILSEVPPKQGLPPLFLDAKVYQDEPYAMQQSMDYLLGLFKPRYVTVPAAVSNKVLETAVKTVADFNKNYKRGAFARRKLIMSLPFPNLTDDECVQRYGRNPLATAEAMTMWALQNGLDGLVCGPRELPIVKETRKAVDIPDFMIIVAGIRSAKDIATGANDANWHKQQICTAADALGGGADAILVGRAVTHAEDSCAAFVDIVNNAATVG